MAIVVIEDNISSGGKWTDQHNTSVGLSNKKVWDPYRNQTYDLPNTGRGAQFTELQELKESKV